MKFDFLHYEQQTKTTAPMSRANKSRYAREKCLRHLRIPTSQNPVNIFKAKLIIIEHLDAFLLCTDKSDVDSCQQKLCSGGS